MGVHDCRMTTLHVVGDQGETLTTAVARRLRGKLAESRITGIELSKRTGMGRAMISRRLSGETALNTDELELIEHVTGISAAYLLTGRGEESPRPDGPDGGEGGESAPSRARTYDLRITRPSVSLLSVRQTQEDAA